MNADAKKQHVYSLKQWCLLHGYRNYGGARFEKDGPKGTVRLVFGKHILQAERLVWTWSTVPCEWRTLHEAFYSEVYINPTNNKIRGLTNDS